MAAIAPVERASKLRARVTWAAFCLATVGFLSGCDTLPFGYTKIGEIVAKAPQFEGREVKVRGTVTDVSKIPLLDIKSYVLQDDSGKIIVIAPESLPETGKEIAVRGIVESVLIVRGESFGLTLKETARLRD